jgi:glutamyl-tRNA(Gln) amidotransferase subunit D
VKESLKKPGDFVEVKTKDQDFSGILMPSRDSNVIVLKSESGYNMGIDKKKILKMSLKKRGMAPADKKERVLTNKKGLPDKKGKTLSDKKGLPKIAIISTGGTISSRVDYKTGAVNSLISSSQLVKDIPELGKIANIKYVELMKKLSEDINLHDWKRIAKAVHSELVDDDVSGIIVTHGTDTMHYTSAALSFMINNLNKPVVLTGSQRSPDRGSSDSKMNLICSAHLATSNLAEVMICMHGSENDDFCLAHLGTKVRKMHTSRRDAFQSINAEPVAKVFADGKIELISGGKRRNDEKPALDTRSSPEAGIVYIHGNIDPKLIDFHIKNKYKGLVLMGTGMGHAPSREFISALKRAVKSGINIFMTSQCLYGRVNPSVYSTARKLMDSGVVYLKDMLPETALVKLMWVLGHSEKSEEINRMMLENLSGEFENRSRIDQKIYKQ